MSEAKTDRELLELAAKAAGYGRLKYFDDVPYVAHGLHGEDFFAWSPRADDSDAFRLAVKLGLLDENPGFTHELAAQMGAATDPYAATRSAIVLAAAAIGEAMK